MKIKEVELGKTINMGNYESYRVKLTAEVEEGETVNQVLEKLDSKLLSLEKRAKTNGCFA